MNVRYIFQKLTIYGSIVLFVSFIKVDSSKYNIPKINSAFNNYVDSLHPQKIYLHIDKNLYFAREKIRFNSYLVDGIEHRPDSADRHIYVELLDPYKRVVQILRILQNKGTGSGEFYLSDTIPEGIYQIRAYTNRMKNFGTEFYFNRNISVHNQLKEYLITNKQARSNNRNLKQKEKKKSEYYISFFPEGGQILTGINCKVAFKAINQLGNSIPATGKIFNSSKMEITSFSTTHNGMGFFYLNPNKDESYYAMVSFNDEPEIKVALPRQMENFVSLRLTNNEKSVLVHLQSNKILSNDRSSNEYILLAQERGKIIYINSLNLIENDTLIEVDREKFSSGVVQFTLIDNRLLPVSERLFFINQPEVLSFSIEAGSNKENIDLFINPRVANNYSKSVINASIAVLLLNDNKSLPRENILSELFLTSDLPGIIENPLYYFQKGKEEVDENADLLMLTNGWRRYYWPDIIEGNFPRLKYESEQGITIKGKITHELLDLPYKNADVRLFIMDRYNDEFSTMSGIKGEFEFNNLNYKDTIDVKIQVRKVDGGKNLLIQLEEDLQDGISEYSGDFFLTTTSRINKKELRNIKNELARKKLADRERELDSIFSGSIYGRPDFVLWEDDFPYGSSNLLDIIKGRIPGVSVNGNSVIIRGIGSINGNIDPLILVDGVPAGYDILYSISPSDVERIEILKGSNTAIYGSRGGNGVIAVYLKHGSFMVKGQISFSMLGYHKEEKFISPSQEEISTREQANLLPMTINWTPKIILGTDHETKISFTAPKTGSKMILIVEGIDTKGNPGVSLRNLSR